MKRLTLTLAALSILPATAHAQSNIEITKVSDTIHMLTSPNGGNVTASVGQDGAFIIDDNLPGRSEPLTSAIKSIKDQNINFVLNTHYHNDHTGTNEAFGNQGAIIVAHDNVRTRLSSEQVIEFFNKTVEPLSKEGLPIITFSQDMTLHYNDNDIEITYVPNAHTDGDSIAYFKDENVITAGDALFNGRYPFIDVEHGGTIQGMIAAQDKILEIANDQTAIIPGHGPLTNKAELQGYKNTLSTIADKVEAAIKEGKTLEEIQAMKPTAEFDEKLGGDFIKPDVFVSFVYESLVK